MEYHSKLFLPYRFCVLFSNSSRLCLHVASYAKADIHNDDKAGFQKLNELLHFQPLLRSRFCHYHYRSLPQDGRFQFKRTYLFRVGKTFIYILIKE